MFIHPQEHKTKQPRNISPFFSAVAADVVAREMLAESTRSENTNSQS